MPGFIGSKIFWHRNLKFLYFPALKFFGIAAASASAASAVCQGWLGICETS